MNIKAICFKNIITFHPKEINQAFQEYYSTLYKSQSNYTQEELQHYLENCKLPKLSESDQQSLDAPFMEQETLAAINLMPLDNSPGPDSIPATLYKEYWTDLKPIFISMINNFIHKNILPQTISIANIVLHKIGKNPLECSSCRPISLLDHYFKIITKVLAKRVEKKYRLN